MRYRLLGPSGLRVSELCLGTMTFGDDWGWGADDATSHQIFERFAEAGGNFIDTSNNYTNGSSERLVGACIREARDRYVVATKYSLRNPAGDALNANLGGNSRKSMQRSVERSLRALGTDYIDLLYLHMWDFATPVDEVLLGAQQLVSSGKLLYFAFSDTPAWVVSHAVARAEQHGWPRPVAVQAPYSVAARDVERELLPMARGLGLAFLAWDVLDGGVLTGKYSRPPAAPRRESDVSARRLAAGAAVAQLAGEIGATPAQVALAWVRQRPGNIIPIVGARTAQQIEENLGCLNLTLTDDQIAALDAIAGFELGFPLSFLESDHVHTMIYGDTYARLDRR